MSRATLLTPTETSAQPAADSTQDSAALTLAAGLTIEDFVLLKELGQGGIATVYLARQQTLDRDVALKISKEGDINKEGKTLAKLDHPNVVRIFSDSVAQNGLRLTAMEWVRGASLGTFLSAQPQQTQGVEGRDWLKTVRTLSSIKEAGGSDRPLEKYNATEAVLFLGLNLARALAHAHERKVMHLDVKPDNILIDLDGTPKLADFNVSSFEGFREKGFHSSFGGTPAYMSPEQTFAMNSQKWEDIRRVTYSTDVYSAGRVLVEVAKKTLSADQREEFARFDETRTWSRPVELSTAFGQLQAATAMMLREDPSSRPNAVLLEREFKNALLFSQVIRKLPVSKRVERFSLYSLSLVGAIIGGLFCLIGQSHNRILSPSEASFNATVLYLMYPLALVFIADYVRRFLRDFRQMRDSASMESLRARAHRFRARVLRLPLLVTFTVFALWLFCTPGFKASLLFSQLSLLGATCSVIFVPAIYLVTTKTFVWTLRWVHHHVFPAMWAGNVQLREQLVADREMMTQTVTRYRDIAVIFPLGSAILLLFRLVLDFRTEPYAFSAARQVEFIMLGVYQMYASTRLIGWVEEVYRELNVAEVP